jgi:hypothetical protein
MHRSPARRLFRRRNQGYLDRIERVWDWYPLFNKPSWNPPCWVFGPAWTLLYTLMSVAAWRTWLRRDQPGRPPPAPPRPPTHRQRPLVPILFFGQRPPRPRANGNRGALDTPGHHPISTLPPRPPRRPPQAPLPRLGHLRHRSHNSSTWWLKLQVNGRCGRDSKLARGTVVRSA